MKISILLFVLLLAVAGAGGGYWWWTVGSIPMPVRLCEERIKEMLKSPTSYQRSSYSYIQETHDFDRDEFINAKMEIDKYTRISQLLGKITRYDPMKAGKELEDRTGNGEVEKKLGMKFTKVLVGVEFDSKNPIGTLLRSNGYCKWVKYGTGPDSITWDHSDVDEAGLFLLSK
jgi:hypothetical protein